MDAPFDYAFVGFGLSGMLLARRIAARFPAARILIVDPKLDDDVHGTYACWRTDENELSPLCRARFTSLRVRTIARAVDAPLAHYTYEAFELRAVRAAMLSALRAHAGVQLVAAPVAALDDHEDGVTVRTDAQRFDARFAFDSRPPDLRGPLDAHTSLVQSFAGVEVELTDEVREPSRATFMDFTCTDTRADSDGLVFGYMLPWGARRAFVETVRIAERAHAPPDPRAFIASLCGAPCARVIAEESGATLLTDGTLERRPSPHVLHIGRLGGRLKPSTGYAVTRILEDTDAIERSLLAHGHPFDLPAPSARFQTLDSVLLQVLHEDPALMPGVFLALFEHNPADRVLRFLDEEASAVDVMKIIASMPAGPFVRALGARSIP